MGNIKLKIASSAPVEDIFGTSRMVYEMVEHLPNIKEIHVMEVADEGKYTKAEWVLDIKLPVPHGKLAWLQEIRWDEAEKECRFGISPDNKGIVKRFDGTLLFRPGKKGSEMIMDIFFQVEHPLVTPMVQGIFDGIMKRNNESLLLAIKKKTEERLVE